jgi:hypothetical protein
MAAAGDNMHANANAKTRRRKAAKPRHANNEKEGDDGETATIGGNRTHSEGGEGRGSKGAMPSASQAFFSFLSFFLTN